MKKYIHIVTVVVKAPAGYSPRQRSFNAAVLSNKISYRRKAEENVLNIIRKANLDTKVGDLELTFHVSSITKEIIMFMVDEETDELQATKPLES
jgi:hypothetical protein